MSENYFTRLKDQTQTRLWVNNPTDPEIDKAIAHGAVSCTTNPAFCANLLRRDHDYVINTINDCLKESSDDNVVADLVQQKLVSHIMEKFRPVYDSSEGRNGFVSIQGNPRHDRDAGMIVSEIERYRKLGINMIAKIPATEAGFKAIEILLAENIPVIATEVFALSQLVQACEVYKRATGGTAFRPSYYVTHITGIFDDYVKDYVEKEKISIAPELRAQAGLILARRLYEVFSQRNYPGNMLGGGARNTDHFTGLVGGNMHITINWSTAEEILVLNPPLENLIALKPDQKMVDELLAKIPAFKLSWLEDGMTVKEFEDFGPVQRFRNQFVSGWDQLLAAIDEQRKREA